MSRTCRHISESVQAKPSTHCGYYEHANGYASVAAGGFNYTAGAWTATAVGGVSNQAGG